MKCSSCKEEKPIILEEHIVEYTLKPVAAKT